jgi:hypothetical protein
MHWNASPMRSCPVRRPRTGQLFPPREEKKKKSQSGRRVGGKKKKRDVSAQLCGSDHSPPFTLADVSVHFLFLQPICMLQRCVSSLFIRSPLHRLPRHPAAATTTATTATTVRPFLAYAPTSPCRSRPPQFNHPLSSSSRSNMTHPASPLNPASLFKSPIRAIWNVQGENVPTLWWPAKSSPSDQAAAHKGSDHPEPHTVLFMIPGIGFRWPPCSFLYQMKRSLCGSSCRKQ